MCFEGFMYMCNVGCVCVCVCVCVRVGCRGDRLSVSSPECAAAFVKILFMP